MLTWVIFLISFFEFFMFTIFGIPDIESRKEGCSHRPARPLPGLCPKVGDSLCLNCFNLKSTFSCGLPT